MHVSYVSCIMYHGLKTVSLPVFVRAPLPRMYQINIIQKKDNWRNDTTPFLNTTLSFALIDIAIYNVQKLDKILIKFLISVHSIVDVISVCKAGTYKISLKYLNICGNLLEINISFSVQMIDSLIKTFNVRYFYVTLFFFQL